MSLSDDVSRSSDYIQYLPAILQADPFLQRFLLAFEQILTGDSSSTSQCPGIIRAEDTVPVGLEAVLNQIQTYLDPQLTDPDFLPWLAGWVALSLRDDWDEKTKRAFIQQIVPLYQRRGTCSGLKDILRLYLHSLDLPETVDIFEAANYPANYFGTADYPSHYFQVQLKLPKAENSKYWSQIRIARAIIEQEKPAHTYYALRILTDSMRLTGNRYALVTKPQAESTVSVEVKQVAMTEAKSGDPAPLLRVSIKVEGLLQPIATIAQRNTQFQLTQLVTADQAAANGDWYVLIDNLNKKQCTATLTITVTVAAQAVSAYSNNPITLEPGLQIMTRDKADGNTLIGTQAFDRSSLPSSGSSQSKTP